VGAGIEPLLCKGKGRARSLADLGRAVYVARSFGGQDTESGSAPQPDRSAQPDNPPSPRSRRAFEHHHLDETVRHEAMVREIRQEGEHVTRPRRHSRGGFDVGSPRRT